MSVRVRCEYCGQEATSGTTEALPDDCPNCYEPLPEAHTSAPAEPEAAPAKAGEALSGIVFTYTKTQQSIEVEFSGQIVLGRNHVGSDFFEDVPQVSRRHCRIEQKGEYLTVTDLDSTNGTFLGHQKKECRAHSEQPLRDGVLLYLGREPLRVELKHATVATTSDARQRETDDAEAVNADRAEADEDESYLCCNAHCGYVAPSFFKMCPKCKTYQHDSAK